MARIDQNGIEMSLRADNKSIGASFPWCVYCVGADSPRDSDEQWWVMEISGSHYVLGFNEAEAFYRTSLSSFPIRDSP